MRTQSNSVPAVSPVSGTNQPFNGNAQRVDKRLTFQPHALNTYGKDARLCKKVIYYLMTKIDSDIFGFLRLDPHQFAQEAGIARTVLAAKHPKPYQLTYEGETLSEAKIQELKEKGFLFETNLENALFRIAYQRISLEIKASESADGDSDINGATIFDFFEEIRVITDKKNRNKKTYYLKPSIKFATEFSRYTLINRKRYFELSKNDSVNNTGDLYLWLQYVKQRCIASNQPFYPAHINAMAKVLNCLDKKFSKNGKKKETLDKHLKEIQKGDENGLGLIFEWRTDPKRPNSPYKDICMLRFSNLERTKQALYDNNTKVDRAIFYFDKHLILRLMDAFVFKYKIDASNDEFRDNFTAWFAATETDIQVKQVAYNQSYKDLWNEECPHNYSAYYFTHLRHLSGEFERRV